MRWSLVLLLALVALATSTHAHAAAAAAAVDPAANERLHQSLLESMNDMPSPEALAKLSPHDLQVLIHDVLARLQAVPEWRDFTANIDQLVHEINALPADYAQTRAPLLDPDCTYTHCESANAKGYGCETHVVQTADGFLLTVFRVYKGLPAGKPPVLLSHGLVDTSFSWILSSPNTTLGYMLADAGYDVWLGNVRGNKYGRGHVTYSEFDPKLWDSSFDEQGEYDVPSTIDYALSANGASKIAVVGHSQGCTQMFGAMQQHPSLESKVSLFVALAPAGYFRHLNNWLVRLAAGFYVADIAQLFGIDQFLNLPDDLQARLPVICDKSPKLVYSLLAVILGDNPGEIDLEKMEVICAQSLGWTSMHNMVHWSQLIRDKVLHYYDYVWKNREHYGQRNAPDYAVNSWPPSVPIAVFYGGNDKLVHPTDAEELIGDIPERSLVFEKIISPYAHCDFTWGVNAHTNIYNETLSLMALYHQL